MIGKTPLDNWKLAVNNHAEAAISLEVGDIIEGHEVTEVGTHTIQFKTRDGHTGATQITFIDSMGNLTWAGAWAQMKLIESAFPQK